MENVNDIINNLTVLYVEDDDITRIIMKKILTKKVKKLIVGKNGQEGLILYKKYTPDIIITDLRMPLLNGIHLIKQIRTVDHNCGIIIASEIKDIQYITKTIDIGIDKYLIKPLNSLNVIDALQTTALKLFSRKFDKYSLNNLLLFTKEDELLIKNTLKSKISAFIKQHIGKGPQQIKVDFIQNTLQIQAYDVLTSMEKSLLEKQDNFMLVEYNRRLFYENKKTFLENMIGDVLQKNVELQNIKISILENIDELLLIIN